MNVVRRIIFAVILSSVGFGISSTDAHAPTPIKPVPLDKFTKIFATEIREEHYAPSRYVNLKPKISIPASPVITVRNQVPTNPTKHLTKGTASYYCLAGKSRCTRGHSGGMYAAIRKNLLYLRGRTVQVCRTGTKICIFVKIIDCNCGPNANLIDLYSDAFKKLRPLFYGTVKVTVKW